MSSTPSCIGVILDGNRRYAKERGLPSFEGHRRGFERTKELLEWAQDAGIHDVILYAFSTENWNRSPEEVAYLMDLYEEFANTWAATVKERKGRIRFIGELSRFRDSLQKKMRLLEEETKENTAYCVWVCLSYGGRAEILAAVNRLLENGAQGPIDENEFRAHMWSAEMPDPDLIMRTSGEHRLSNFLTWQSVYSELFFPKPHLPALTKADFDAVLEEYAARERRHGK
ncbi:MAG: polyprenyl diphosphate synthase [Minisyncoccia bacterium]